MGSQKVRHDLANKQSGINLSDYHYYLEYIFKKYKLLALFEVFRVTSYVWKPLHLTTLLFIYLFQLYKQIMFGGVFQIGRIECCYISGHIANTVPSCLFTKTGKKGGREREKRRKGGVCSVCCGVVDNKHLYPAGEKMAAFSNQIMVVVEFGYKMLQ